jgi:ATP-dependent exoDNAse (exonuclease V) beta subunit
LSWDYCCYFLVSWRTYSETLNKLQKILKNLLFGFDNEQLHRFDLDCLWNDSSRLFIIFSSHLRVECQMKWEFDVRLLLLFLSWWIYSETLNKLQKILKNLLFGFGNEQLHRFDLDCLWNDSSKLFIIFSSWGNNVRWNGNLSWDYCCYFLVSWRTYSETLNKLQKILKNLLVGLGDEQLH